MRILIDARLYGLENAGLGRYVTNLIEHLEQTDKENRYVILLRKKYFDTLKLSGNWEKVLADYRHYSFLEQLMLPFLIYQQKPDLVHFPHFNVPVLYGGKFVVTIHDTLMHSQKGVDSTTLIAPLYFIKRLAYHFVFRRAVVGSRSVIVPSLTVKKNLLSEYKIKEEKVKVTYEGVDEKIGGANGMSVQKPYFVYIGNAYPHKNLPRLVKAMVSLNKNYNQIVTLAIASARNIFTRRLEKLIAKHDAEGFVKLLGFVPDEEIGGLLKNSRGYVFPSLSEGFGLPGLEAMKAGTLLLASEIPVFKEVYADCAIYFNHLDFSSIEKAMLTALTMPEDKRQKMIAVSREFVKKYSWTKMAKETLKIYKAVV